MKPRHDQAMVEEGGVATRTAILDAVVRCIATQGWAGTNMSLVSRETGMTRGKIQYYFPVLEELKRAAIDHLYERWRRDYFDRMRSDARGPQSIVDGVDVLWQLAREPQHRAMLEIEAAARTDDALREVLTGLQRVDEEQLRAETVRAFPDLAALTAGTDQLTLARYFVSIFVDGLAAHGFTEDAGRWQSELLAMLKECLLVFWERRGLDGAQAAATAVSAPALDPRREEARALLTRAAELLAD